MARKNAAVTPVSRARLLHAMENIPDDVNFLCRMAINDGEDFLKGLRLNRPLRLTKAQVLAEINASSFQAFPCIPGFEDQLLLTPRLYVWKESINRSQRFPATPGAERYTHVQDKGNPYYDIYFRLDRERKTIIFALGNKLKEVPVIEHTEWSWQPTREGLLCQDIDRLEQYFLDPHWNPIAVDIGRKVLKIKPII